MLDVAGIKAYKVTEAAQILDLSTQTLRTYIKTGRIKAQRNGRAYYITEDALREFISGGVAEKDGKETI